MKYFINYADKRFEKSQRFGLRMAHLNGRFDEVIGFNDKDIDPTFYDKNRNILNQRRGGGYWLWKPYFIYNQLLKLNTGDYLFYCDSGAYFLKPVDILIKELEQFDQDIMGYELPLIESQWTKKELFFSMNCNEESFKNSNQIMASYKLIKKTDFSLKFFKDFLNYSCNEINITDKFIPSVTQDIDFIDHRHDQSIFSLLYKKYQLRPFKDPSQYGQYPGYYAGTRRYKYKQSKKYYLGNGRKYFSKVYPESYNSILFHHRAGKPLLSFFIHKLKHFF